MNIESEVKGDVALVRIIGKLTAISLDQSLRGMVRGLFADQARAVILDMENVNHIDSTGVGELVSAYMTSAREEGTLYLYNVPENVFELLEITNLLDVFKILKDDDELLKEF